MVVPLRFLLASLGYCENIGFGLSLETRVEATADEKTVAPRRTAAVANLILTKNDTLTCLLGTTRVSTAGRAALLCWRWASKKHPDSEKGYVP